MTDARWPIAHDAASCRFTLRVDGLDSVVDYALAGRVMHLHHTGVPAALQGRGIAAALVSHALQHARAQGWQVRPLCSYAEAYMRRHRDTLDLLAPG
jgi:predicted GNAT family acetyltransferase